MDRRILIFLMLVFFPLDSYSDWPYFMRDEKRTGYESIDMKVPFKEKWEIEVGGEILSSPIIYNKKVFITTTFGYIVGVDLETGNYLWNYSVDSAITMTPFVSSNTLVVGAANGKVYAIDINTGVLKWERDLGGAVVSSGVLYKKSLYNPSGLVYIGSGVPSNSLYILDFKDGSIVRQIEFSKPVNSAITICGDRVVFGGNDGRIYSMNYDGSDLRYYQTPGGSFHLKAIACRDDVLKLYSVPGYDERSFYVNDFKDTTLLYKSEDLSGNIGVDQWNWQDSSSIAISSSALYLVAGTSSTFLFSYKLADYSLVFSSIEVGSVSEYKISPSPSLSLDKIFLTTNNSKFYILSSTGAILQTFDLTSPSYSSVAISDGYVVVGEHKSVVRGYQAAEYLYFDIPYDEVLNSTTAIKIKGNSSKYNYLDLSYSKDGREFVSISTIAVSSSTIDISYDLNVFLIGESTITLKATLYDQSNSPYLTSYKLLDIHYKPQPPVNLIARDNPNDNGNKILLGWEYPLSDVVFNIYRKKENADWSFLASTTSKSFIDNLALTGTTFYYRITAYNGYFESDFSNISFAYSINDNPLNDTIPPQAVIDLMAAKGNKGGSIILRWSETGDDGKIGKATSYEIRYTTYQPFIWENAEISTINFVMANPGDIESVIIDGLLSNLTYYFAVKIYDYAKNASPLSNIAIANPQVDLTPPAAVVGFDAYDTPYDRGGSITLVWDLSKDDGSGENDVYGYKIFRSTYYGFDYSRAYAVVKKGKTGYIDNYASTGVKYFYQVGAYDSTNLSLSPVKSAISSDNYVFVDMRRGGVIYSKDGSMVVIDKDCLTQDDYLLFYRLDGSLSPASFSPSSLKNSSVILTPLIYELKPSNPGTSLKSSILVLIHYNENEVIGIDEKNLRIFYFDGNTLKPVRKFNLDSNSNVITAEVNKIGVYGVFGYLGSGDVFDDDFVYTYPNPAKGDRLTFKFSLNYNADVEIRIYNIAGEMVDKIEINNVPALKIIEKEWDIRKFASGVYVYVFQANAAGRSKKIEKKLAIIK